MCRFLIASLVSLCLAATASAQPVGPFLRLPWELIAAPMTLPVCANGDSAWMYALGSQQVIHCVNGEWVTEVVGAVGPAGPPGPPGEDGEDGADGASLPAGVIVMWSGTLASIPSGWALCDGAGGRPDLRDKFVKGAAAGQNPGATGGAATHGHAYTETIQHQHAVNVNDPGHAHVENQNSAATGALVGFAARDTSTSTSTATGYSTATATTGVTATTSNPAGSVATGNTQTASSEPPFVTVAFICKL